MEICSRCGYLVIFRNYWPLNRHQPFHIPTGWPCWKMEKEDPTLDPADRLPFPRGGDESDRYWKRLRNRVRKRYASYENTGIMKPFLELVRSEIAAGNYTMTGNILWEVINEIPSSRQQRNSLLGQLMVDEAWQSLSDQPTRP